MGNSSARSKVLNDKAKMAEKTGVLSLKEQVWELRILLPVCLKFELLGYF
jgi:hypothetical protein